MVPRDATQWMLACFIHSSYEKNVCDVPYGCYLMDVKHVSFIHPMKRMCEKWPRDAT